MIRALLWPVRLAGAIAVWCAFLAVLAVAWLLVAAHTIATGRR